MHTCEILFGKQAPEELYINKSMSQTLLVWFIFILLGSMGLLVQDHTYMLIYILANLHAV